MNGRFCRLMCAAVVLAGPGATARDIVWSGTQTVDRVVRFEHGENLVLKPGTHVAFVGAGRIAIRDASFRAEGAELVAAEILTNAYRICVQNGSFTMTGCRARGLRSHEPVKGVCYLRGSMYSQMCGGRLADNTFIDCSPVAYLNATGVEVARNVFIRPHEGGAYLFNVTSCRASDNAFFDASAAGLMLNGTHLTEVTGNRFTDCVKGITASGIKSCRIVGNSFFGGTLGIDLWWDGKDNLFLANLFDGVKSAAVVGYQGPYGDGDIFANNLVVNGGHGFLIPAIPKDRRLIVRNNGFVNVGLALRLDGGTLEATDNAVWQAKYGCQARNGAALTTSGLIRDDPRFVSAEDHDWRLRKDSPWRRTAAKGGNVGMFQ